MTSALSSRTRWCRVIIIDDYGDWQGSRKTTDEYLAEHGSPLCLVRIDVGARMAVKP